MIKKRDIAIVLQNMVQFYNIKNLIDILVREGKSIDLYIPKYKYDKDFNKIYNNAYNNISKLNYNVYRTEQKNIKYKILLECYEIDNIISIKHDYRLMFKYGSLSSAPSKTHKANYYLPFDGVFVYSKIEESYFSAFCKTYLVGNIKFLNYKKEKNFGKKRILYLPTYGNLKQIKKTIKALEKISDKYHIIVKIHHGTNYLSKEKEYNEKLKQISAEFYESDVNFIELLKKTDIVLSDNSGAIFDSIYAEVPVVLFADDINANNLGENFNTHQYDAFKDGVIPYTNNINEIEEIIIEGLKESTIINQKKWKNRIFYTPNDLSSDFISIINDYLNDKIDFKYIKLHRSLYNDYKNLVSENKKLITYYNSYKDLVNKNNELTINYNNKCDKLIEQIKIYKKEISDLKLQNNKLNNRFNRIYMKFKMIFSKIGGKINV